MDTYSPCLSSCHEQNTDCCSQSKVNPTSCVHDFSKCLLGCQNKVIPSPGQCLNQCTGVSIDCIAEGKDHGKGRTSHCMNDWSNCVNKCHSWLFNLSLFKDSGTCLGNFGDKLTLHFLSLVCAILSASKCSVKAAVSESKDIVESWHFNTIRESLPYRITKSRLVVITNGYPNLIVPWTRVPIKNICGFWPRTTIWQQPQGSTEHSNLYPRI